MPAPSASRGPPPVPATWKDSASVVVPSVVPSTRAVACIPPAPPARPLGAAESMVRLLGVMKVPKPAPQSATTAPVSTTAPAATTAEPARSASPVARAAMPAAQRSAVGRRSDRRPASGAATARARGQGVSSSAASAWPRPAAWNRNGSDR